MKIVQRSLAAALVIGLAALACSPAAADRPTGDGPSRPYVSGSTAAKPDRAPLCPPVFGFAVPVMRP